MAFGDKKNSQTENIQDEPLIPKEQTPQTDKVPLMEKFIATKLELERYSMTQAFKNFCVKNTSRLGLKNEDDFEKAFQEFYGVKEK
ncbi:MAG: hypothetical protein HS129_05010 [Leptospiraceae bacterium]|nr:hypothetical protein [Leptospiraceae bacterium]NUM41549.1 hypothetical protein [Leptospiraceae bacterium]